MSAVSDSLPKETCKRCGHEWIKRVLKPRVCPKCQSPYWDVKPTRRKKGELLASKEVRECS